MNKHVYIFFIQSSAVGVSYMFGFLVLVLSAVGFFFGSNAQKVCQSLQGPDYEGFTNVRSLSQLYFFHIRINVYRTVDSR